jgi:hypothetical protein
MAEIVSWAEVQSLIDVGEIRDRMDEDSRVLLYNDHTKLDYLDLEFYDQYDDYTTIIVNGDLHVKGNVFNENTDGALSLFVLGNLYARNVLVGGQVIYVKGDISVDEVLIGSYNHGDLYCYAQVSCPLIIDDDYHFNLSADVKIMDANDEDDLLSLTNLINEDLFNEEGQFNFYAAHAIVKAGGSILQPVMPFTEILPADFEAIIDSPLFGPDTAMLDIGDGAWFATLIRVNAESGPLLILNNVDADLQYYWLPDETGKVNTYVKNVLDNTQFTAFDTLRKIVRKQEKWNERHKVTIDQEHLWKLIWMFSPYEDHEKYLPMATAVFTRTLYAATFPFAYLHDAYKTTPSVKMALIDGLIAAELIQEIAIDKTMGEESAKLNIVTSLCWDVVYEIHEHYQQHPVDRPFIMDLNEGLLVYSGAILKLDTGTENYIIAGMHTNNISLFTDLAQQFEIYPKYYLPADKVEENALKVAAVAIEDDIRYNKCRGLMPYRKFAAQLWNYRYNEHGDVEYWEDCFDKLRSALITKSGMVGTKVSAEDFDFWWDWYKRCQLIIDEQKQ